MATGEGVQAFCRYKDHGYAGSHPRPHPSGGPKIFVCDMFIPSNMNEVGTAVELKKDQAAQRLIIGFFTHHH